MAAKIKKINVQEIEYDIQGILYDKLGTNDDGPVTQKLITDMFIEKFGNSSTTLSGFISDITRYNNYKPVNNSTNKTLTLTIANNNNARVYVFPISKGDILILHGTTEAAFGVQFAFTQTEITTDNITSVVFDNVEIAYSASDALTFDLLATAPYDGYMIYTYRYDKLSNTSWRYCLSKDNINIKEWYDSLMVTSTIYDVADMADPS